MSCATTETKTTTNFRSNQNDPGFIHFFRNNFPGFKLTFLKIDINPYVLKISILNLLNYSPSACLRGTSHKQESKMYVTKP